MHNLPHLSLHQMESAISLSYCPFPYGSKGFQFQAARTSRIHLKFNHATPLCLPQISTTTHHVFRHTNCMLERVSVPSKNEGKSCNKILRGVTAVPLVLACVLGLFSFSAKVNPKFTTAYAILGFPSLTSPAKSEPSSPAGNSEGTFKYDVNKVEGDGMSVLKSLYEIMSDPGPSTDSNKKTNVPSENEVKRLKKRAFGKSKSKVALDELINVCKKYQKNSQAKEYLGVALVEAYMFQGDFTKARNLLDQQIHELLHLRKEDKPNPEEMCVKLLDEYQGAVEGYVKNGIAQRILYKAIVLTMLGQKEANEWWEAFTALLPESKYKI